MLRFEDKNIQDNLPLILKKKNPNVKIPSKISDLIRKIENKFAKSLTDESKDKILRETLPVYSEDANLIGNRCSQVGLFSNLLDSTLSVHGKITNGIIYELEKFRCKNNKTYVEFTKWVHYIFGLEKETFTEQSVRQSVKSLMKTRLEMSRKSSSLVENFLNDSYVYPKMGVEKTASECTNAQCQHEKTKIMKCSRAIQNLNFELYKEKEELENELLNEYKETEQLTQKLEKIIREKSVSDKEYSSIKTRYETMLCRFKGFDMRNVNKKLKTREQKIEKINQSLIEEKGNVKKLEKICEKKDQEILELKSDKRKLQKRASYFKVANDSEIQNRIQNEKLIELQENNKELENQNIILQQILEESENINCFKTRKEGRREFCDEIKKTYMELISLGVSCNMCASVIKSVIKNITGQELNDLPEVTFAKRMALQANLIAKYQIASELLKNDSENTLQFDGTSKWGEHFFTFDINTPDRSLTSSIMDLDIENSKTQLDATKRMFSEFSEIFQSMSQNPEEINCTVSKMVKTIHNTMSDRGPTNKPYIKLFQNWRESLLPTAIQNWEFIDENTKKSLVEVHDFYCGLHLLTNFADYANKSLKKFEEICTNENIGMKKLSQFQSWGTRAESAAQRLIRSTCNLLQVGGSETAGRPQQFNAFLQEKGVKNNLVPFRGNRFNILFQNARATYGHCKHINEFLEMHGLDNNLLISVKADIESSIALAGVRALGLIDVHITRPLWKILDNPEISVTDMSLYYKKMHDTIERLVVDASPIMNETFQMFENYPPEKKLFGFSELHAYNNNNEELDILTTQALELSLASILSVIKRQLVDHLEGKHSDPSNELVACASSVPKTNQSNESNFGQLDRIKRFKPNATTAHIEGLILFTNNKTSDWLNESNNENEIFSNVSKLLPKFIEKWRKRSKEIKNKRLEILKLRAEENNRKKMKKIAEKQKIVDNILKFGQCKSEQDVNRLMRKFGTNQSKLLALKLQLKYYKFILNFDASNTLYKFSTNGKPSSVKDLQSNLLQVINNYSEQVHVNLDFEPPRGPNIRPLAERQNLLKVEQEKLKVLKVHVVPKETGENENTQPQNKKCKRKLNLNKEHEVPKPKKSKSSTSMTTNANACIQPNFSFCLNQWVAVAGESDWFIGQAVDIISSENAVVNFMQKCNINTFKWSSPPALETVHIKSVIHANFDIEPKDSSLRFWTIGKPCQKIIAQKFSECCQ